MLLSALVVGVESVTSKSVSTLSSLKTQISTIIHTGWLGRGFPATSLSRPGETFCIPMPEDSADRFEMVGVTDNKD